MSQKKQISARTIGRDDNRLQTGTLVEAKKTFGAVPACGTRAKVRISEGTKGIVEDGILKSSVVGVPDYPFVSFEAPNGRVVCVAADPSVIAAI
jgi:hypothetical protein